MALFLGLVVAIKSVVHLSHKSFTLLGEWWCLSLVRLMLFVCTGKKLFCRFCLPVQVTWSFASFLSGPLLLSPQTLRSDHYPTFSRGSSYEHFNFSCSSSKSWFPESCPIVFSLSRCRFYCGYLPNPKHPKPPRVSRLHQNEKKTFQKKGKGVWQETL